MIDWVYGSEHRNYGIKKKKNIISAKELIISLLILIPLTGTIVFHLWVRSEVTDTGYKIRELSQREDTLLRMREKLIIKEEVLQSPDRIDRIARVLLEMEPLRPEQVLAPQIPYNPADRSILAMAGSNY